MSRKVCLLHSAAVLACLMGELAFPSRTHAQQTRAVPIRTVTEPVHSVEAFTIAPNVRSLPGGRVLVNDQRGKRLLVFDSTLASFTIVADSARTTGALYPGNGLANPLIRYVGDSSLIVDHDARVYMVIDEKGNMVRPMAPVKALDLTAGSRPWSNPGAIASDNQGRLIFRGAETRKPAKPGDPPITDTRDTITIVRADFNERKTDTIAAFSVPRIPSTVFTNVDGKTTASLVINAGLTGPDEFAVLSDGTLAIVREHDYIVDWVKPDGTKSSSEKIPHEWIRQTDEMKQARIDSMKRVIDSVSASGRPYNMIVRSMPSPDGTRSRLDTIIPTIRFAPLSGMADYPTPIRRGQVKADMDGNLWVLPTVTSLSKGGLLYDVISPKEGLHERVQIPPGYLIVGFGRGGVVYVGRANQPRIPWTLGVVRVVRGRG